MAGRAGDGQLTLEDMLPECWAIVVNDFLAVDGLASVMALSQASWRCRAGAHTLRHSVQVLKSPASLRGVVSGAWPRVRFSYFHVATSYVKREMPALIGSLALMRIGIDTTTQGLAQYIGLGQQTVSLRLCQLRYRKGIPAMPDAVQCLDKLEGMEICESPGLTALPDGLGRLPALTSLSLDGCTSLTALPDGLGDLVSLEHLCASHCHRLSTLPPSFGRLRALTTLELSWCPEITALPDDVGALTALTSLNMSWCRGLKALPPSAAQLRSLAHLNLSFCPRLASLPDGVGALESLRTVNLCACSGLAALPPGLARLPNLRALDLSWCEALAAPPGGFRAGTELSLTGCTAKLHPSLAHAPWNLPPQAIDPAS